jgi:ferritin
MATHFEAVSLPGFAGWMRARAEEERLQAMKFFEYVIDRGGRVVLQAIQQPKTEYGDGMEVFKEVLAHEQMVTQSISELRLAMQFP